jgi:hypothetical protein
MNSRSKSTASPTRSIIVSSHEAAPILCNVACFSFVINFASNYYIELSLSSFEKLRPGKASSVNMGGESPI